MGIDYLDGTLWVDEFVTHHQTLDNINKGFDDMKVSEEDRVITVCIVLICF